MMDDGDAEKRDWLMRRALLDLAHETTRLRGFAECDKRLSEITAHPTIADVQLEDALEFGPRLLEPPRIEQAETEYPPQLRVLWVLRDHWLELANRLLPAAGKDQDPCKVVRRIFGEGVERTRALHCADGVGELSLCRQRIAKADMRMVESGRERQRAARSCLRLRKIPLEPERAMAAHNECERIGWIDGESAFRRLACAGESVPRPESAVDAEESERHRDSGVRRGELRVDAGRFLEAL